MPTAKTRARGAHAAETPRPTRGCRRTKTPTAPDSRPFTARTSLFATPTAGRNGALIVANGSLTGPTTRASWSAACAKWIICVPGLAAWSRRRVSAPVEAAEVPMLTIDARLQPSTSSSSSPCTPPACAPSVSPRAPIVYSSRLPGDPRLTAGSRPPLL